MSTLRSPAGPGRPRDPRVDDAALTATRELLVEAGYRKLSLELVARRAGVSRAALYRRWSGKPYLVMDAVFSIVGPASPQDSGRLEDDLTALVDALVTEFSHPAAVAAATGLLAEFGADEAFRTQVRERMLAPVAAAVRDLLARAVERGELPSGAPVDVLLDALGGTVFLRALLLGSPLTPQEGRELVRLLLRAARGA